MILGCSSPTVVPTRSPSGAAHTPPRRGLPATLDGLGSNWQPASNPGEAPSPLGRVVKEHMKRALRRHQQRCAKQRRIGLLKAWYRKRDGGYWWTKQLWKHLRTPYWMGEPGWWVHENMIRPMRIRQNRLLSEILNGKLDPEGVQWPDGKKPHLYYW